jgi:hypothetical protein
MEARITVLVAAALAVAAGVAVVGLDGDDPAIETSGDDGDGASDEEHDFLRDGARASTTDRVSGGSEPVVLADADDPNLLWIADTGNIVRSEDGGQTWDGLAIPFSLVIDGIDLAQGEDGNLYAATTNGATIEFSLSQNDGTSWQATPNTPLPRFQPLDGGGVADRPWLAAGDDGQLGVVWNPGTQPPGTRCVASVDMGQSWADRGALRGSIIAGENSFDAEGNLYWTTRGTLYRQQPAASTALADAGVCSGPLLQKNLFSTGAQALSQTETVGNTVYAAAPSSGNDAIEIAAGEWPDFAQVTLDPVDEETGEELAKNTFVSVSATDDEVAVAWYGTETDGDFTAGSFGGVWNVYTAQIDDVASLDGQTVTCSTDGVDCTRLTTEPNHEGPICLDGAFCSEDRELLDYFMADHGADGTLHVAYADDYDDGDTGDADTHYARVPAS